MDYQEFLQRSGEQDSPSLRQAFQEQFGESNNLGLGPQTELYDLGVHGRQMTNPSESLYSPDGQEGKNFLVATDRYYNPNEFQLSGALEEQKALDAFRNEEFTHHPLTGEPASGNPWQVSDAGPYTYQNEETMLGPIGRLGPGGGGEVAIAPTSLLGPASPALALDAGPSGFASLDAMAGTTLPYAGEGAATAAAAETAASGASSWGGPATFAGNMALNMIPTRDRNKLDTPLGDKGSMSGIVKGGGKGALLGATIGSVVPGVGTGIGAAVGGGLGVIGGAQGYFDSRTPPQIQMSRIRRGGGMPQGLLGGGSMYG